MSLTSAQYIAWMNRCAEALAAAQDELTALDTAIGDGDHGLNMQRGFAKVKEKLAAEAGKDLGSLSKTVGMTLLSSVGGASGPLYGTFSSRPPRRLTAKMRPICRRWRKLLLRVLPAWPRATRRQSATKPWWTSGSRSVKR